MTIDGSKLILYLDDEPIVALDEAVLTIPEREAMQDDILTNLGEWKVESNGRWETPEYTPEQLWRYNWWMARTYPRKKKKAYRKWLKSLIA